MLSVTIAITAITAITSFMAFSNQKLTDKFIFYPPAITNDKEWYRFFSNGLIHADMTHLIFNMFAFYSFGRLVEHAFLQIFDAKGAILYLLMYISALAICLIPTYLKEKNNHYYRSLGASGAVSAVVFAGIFLIPDQSIGFFFIPPIIPGFIFGPIYLFISAYLAKRGGGNINHSAHLWGSLYGIIFLIVTSIGLSNFNPITNFIDAIKTYFGL